MADPKYPHWIPGDDTACTLCSRKHCLWQSEGPDILDDWMGLIRKAKEQDKRSYSTVALRRKYIYKQIIRRVYNSNADIEPPACVVTGVDKLPDEVSWNMVYPRDNYHGTGDRTLD
jgi:hypothetical protein